MAKVNFDKVVLRYWPEHPENPIAIFIDQPYPGNMLMSYQRVGQHGPCSPDIVNCTKLCDFYDEHAEALVKELRSIGYNPKVVKHITYRKYYA